MNLGNEKDRESFRWPISRSATIAAPADRLWETIAAPESLLKSHPYMTANPIDVWGDASSRDEVHYLNGVVYERRFRAWHEGVGFDLEICHRQKPLAWVSWRITPLTESSSSLQITAFPYAMQNLSPLLRWAPHLFVLRPRLRFYLSSVVRGFKWFIEKDEPVPRNQFGSHPWFSRDASPEKSAPTN